jgi:asparagine synthase (glutamine-hydrolysing)
MSHPVPISRVINLISDDRQRLWSVDEAQVKRWLLAGDTEAVLGIDGSFALVAQEGERIVLARSLDRPMRYFLAKSTDGPVLMVAERIDEIAAALARHGWSAQFHPS